MSTQSLEQQPMSTIWRKHQSCSDQMMRLLILHNRRKITADTSIRLGRFFGVSDRYFLDMQNDIEVRELIEKLDGDITTIKPYRAAAM